MGLFNKLTEPVFFKDDSSLDAQLTLYESLVPPAGEQRRQFDRDLWALRQGVSGEKRIRFELSHSHMPMYVLRDLNLAVGDLTAQIDFLLVTRKQTFVVECKNLFGDITIDETGAFTRTIHYPNGHYKKEGIYSPITQNQRHLDLIRQMRSEQKNVFDRIVFNHYFTQSFESVVVLANDETILRTSRAPKEITHQVIRSDQLIKHLRNRVAVSRNDSRSDKQLLQIAEVFLAAHTPHPLQHPVWATDVIVPKHALGVDTSSLTTNQPQPERALPADENAADRLDSSEVNTAPAVERAASPAKKTTMACQRCGAPAVLRTAKKGPNPGNQFYGCSTYPHCRWTAPLDSPEG